MLLCNAKNTAYLRKYSMTTIKVSTLSYICNQEQIDKAVAITSVTNGEYYFIRKIGDKNYYAYRRVDSGAGKHYFVCVNLPSKVYQELIVSGRVARLMG